MDIKDIKRKLQKLLALSASPYEEEAKAAMEKASALMKKYNIRSIGVNEEKNTAEIAKSTVKGYTKRYVAWEAKLASSIASCFDGEALIFRYSDSWELMFIATPSDIEIINDLYIRLRRIISKKSKEYAANNEGHAATLRKSYAFGMIQTIYYRLLSIYKETSSSNALVVVKKDAIEKSIQDAFGNVKRKKDKPPTDFGAYVNGIVDGKTIALHKSMQKATSENKYVK